MGLWALLVLALFLTACAPSQASVETAIAATEQARPSATLSPSSTVQPTNTARPSATITDTPEPTSTRQPTNTRRPSNTPRPTATHTAIPTPILLSGTGSTVVDLAKWDVGALAHITHDGGGNFAIWSYGEDGNRIDLLVNTIGNYKGTVPLDFGTDEQTTRFEITARGSWTIEVAPLETMRREMIPGIMIGEGDDVLFMVSDDPDLLTAKADGWRGNFAVWAYGDRRSLLVNEIAPYEGTVVVPRDALVLVVQAAGPWELEVTSP